eukprot:TRINITY_DN12272_c0_g3_i1.p1 TRINITY_DN12272_c0_g3~~TRINITY_DN12272_c0_g3_i1.p1  ORF type:complete len:453 (-),score=106.52 TRINITY_DN12272_c0_g3_i1:162-1520(-)
MLAFCRHSRLSARPRARYCATARVAAPHPAFTIVDTQHVPEYQLSCSLLRHDTGAEVLSVSADDSNKVFGITFRTPPSDSMGIPHILEHSVLCGSRLYPVKEPFVELLKGSLQTFLNAFTYPDRTCYPVASQNLQDYHNLVRVYLDAVFHPRALSDPAVLEQEGWHYSISDPKDDLKYKGVVFNEMKGVYSSPDSLMHRAMQQALFTQGAYSVDSGGDPLAIPELSFSQFQAFHEQFYHPGNARIFMYGDEDPASRLSLLHEFLSDFRKKDLADSTVSWHPAVDLSGLGPVVEPYPATEAQKEDHTVVLGWVLNHAEMTPKQSLTLGVLDHLLLGNSSSVLYKALTDSGIGKEVTGGGLSDELLHATYSVGLKGVPSERVGDVEKMVMDTLGQIAEDGLALSAIEASLNTIEFRLREFNTGNFPRGLSLMLASMREWIYGRDPVDGLSLIHI